MRWRGRERDETVGEGGREGGKEGEEVEGKRKR